MYHTTRSMNITLSLASHDLFPSMDQKIQHSFSPIHIFSPQIHSVLIVLGNRWILFFLNMGWIIVLILTPIIGDYISLLTLLFVASLTCISYTLFLLVELDVILLKCIMKSWEFQWMAFTMAVYLIVTVFAELQIHSSLFYVVSDFLGVFDVFLFVLCSDGMIDIL